jgi:hypothetical protein
VNVFAIPRADPQGGHSGERPKKRALARGHDLDDKRASEFGQQTNWGNSKGFLLRSKSDGLDLALLFTHRPDEWTVRHAAVRQNDLKISRQLAETRGRQ